MMTDASERAREVASTRPVWRDAADVPFLEADHTPLAEPLRIIGRRRLRNGQG